MTSSGRFKRWCSAARHREVFIARTRADLRQSEWGDEDDFHPGWVAHGLLMGPPADAALFMHRLFTGALLPAPLLAAMREDSQ